jgi:hypothetical protein
MRTVWQGVLAFLIAASGACPGAEAEGLIALEHAVEAVFSAALRNDRRSTSTRSKSNGGALP